MQSSGIHFTTDLKKGKENMVQVIHSSQYCTKILQCCVKHYEALVKRCYIDQKQNRMLF